jgi:amino acid transporter
MVDFETSSPYNPIKLENPPSLSTAPLNFPPKTTFENRTTTTLKNHAEQLKILKQNLNLALEKAEDSSKNNSTFSGIFALVFTFISINVTLFSKVDNLFQGIVFFILFAWCLLTIVYFIVEIKEWSEQKKLKDKDSLYRLWRGPSISFLVLFIFSIIAYKWTDGFTFKNDTKINELKTIEYKYIPNNTCTNT